jgi:peptidoglycan/LPS O-acetylase OafA/YrhL
MAEKLGHRPGLDQIRAVAVLAVLWGHSVRSGPLRYAGGSVGVAVFFTLSGFLITRLMVEERDRTGRLDLRAFYLRRARRLLPPLPLAFGLCVGGAVVLGDDWQRPLAAALTYSINYSDGARSTFSHLWSLAIEEHFYLVWPVVLAITPRRRIVTVALVVGSLSMTARLIVAPSDVAGTATHLSLGGLLLGAAGAVLVERGWRPSQLVTLAGWVTLAGLCLPAAASARASWAPPLIAVASLVVVFSVLDGVRPRPRLERIGAISYGVYLYHFPLALVLRSTALNDYAALAVVSVAAIALAELSFRVIELPAKQRSGGAARTSLTNSRTSGSVVARGVLGRTA